MEDFETEQSRLVRVTLQVDKASSALPKGVRSLDLDVKRSVDGDMRIAALYAAHRGESQAIGDGKGPTVQVRRPLLGIDKR